MTLTSTPRSNPDTNTSDDAQTASFVGDDTWMNHEKYGQKMVVKEGGDKEVCKAGPCWIWTPLIYDDQGDAGLQLL